MDDETRAALELSSSDLISMRDRGTPGEIHKMERAYSVAEPLGREGFTERFIESLRRVGAPLPDGDHNKSES